METEISRPRTRADTRAGSKARSIGIGSVQPMATTRKGPRRRPRGTAQTVGLMVNVEPDVKRLLDDMAAAAGVTLWEVVTTALLELGQTTNADGVPAALATSAQPLLVEAGQTRGGGEVRSAA